MNKLGNLDLAPTRCPAQRVLLQRQNEVLERSLCEGEKAEFRDYTEKQLNLLVETAVSIDCPLISKDLPPFDEPIPEFGTAERSVFAKQCPAYVELNKPKQ